MGGAGAWIWTWRKRRDQLATPVAALESGGPPPASDLFELEDGTGQFELENATGQFELE